MNKINITKIVVLLIIFILILIFIGFLSNKIVNNQINKEIEQFIRDDKIYNEEIINFEDIQGLPNPVKKWLLSINIIGQKKVEYVSFLQKGSMRLSPDQKKSYKSDAKQYVRIKEPAFIWCTDVQMLSFLSVKGIDKFDYGIGSMKMLLGSIIPVVNEKNNEKLNESSLSRFLLELPWYPSAALEDYIIWEEIDEKSAKAKIEYLNMKTEVIYYFDENYNLVKMEGLRYKDTSDESERIICLGEVEDSKIINGMRIPHKINVSWIDNNNKFTWYEIENYDFNFK